MAYSTINVSTNKPKTYDALARLQDYIERQGARDRERDQTPDAWRAARDDLRAGMTEGNYTRWISPAQVHQDGDHLIIGAPDDGTRQWLEHRLDKKIRASLERAGHGHLQTVYEVKEPAPADPRAPRIIESRDDWAAYTQQRFAELGIKPRQGKENDRYNSPLAIHYTMSASRVWWKEHPDQIEAWIEHSAGFIRQLHGDAQILGISMHEHQKTPHMHVAAIPIDLDTGRLTGTPFTREKEQVEALHSLYNRHLRTHGIPLDRGMNPRLERALAAASPGIQQMAVHADDIPLGEVLERLDADRDGRDARRWIIGDRIIQVHDDGHGFTEIGPHGANDGHGAIDLVIRLRQEGREPERDQAPLEQHNLAVHYLATVHPERVMADGKAPPLMPHVPEPEPRPAITRESMPFGTESHWEPGQFILVDSRADAQAALETAKGWGRIAVADSPERLPVDELDEAVAKGWMVDVASRSDLLWAAVKERYTDLTEDQGRQIWRSSAPRGATQHAGHRIVKKQRTVDKERGPDIGPEMMMGGL